MSEWLVVLAIVLALASGLPGLFRARQGAAAERLFTVAMTVAGGAGAFGAVGAVATLGMALGPWAGGWLYDSLGGYFWLYMGSFGIGLGAVAIALTFRPPRRLPAALPSPSVAG